MILAYPPTFIKRIFPSLIWQVNTPRKELFLTFDDGPTPGVTNQVLNILKEFNAKATFFCIGNKVVKNKELFNQIIAEGHTIGNHTYNHKNGWYTNSFEYLKDVQQFENIYTTSYFRPPYGRLKYSQIKFLKRQYKVYMWSILSRDYDAKLTKEECAKIATSNWKKGSIIVFHDSIKAENNMIYSLKEVLKQANYKGWKCMSIEQSN